MNIKDLYGNKTITGVHEVPSKDNLNNISSGHTMGEKLPDYLDTKLSCQQKEILRECAQDGIPIEIHGAISEHFAEVLSRSEYSLKTSKPNFVERKHKNSKKKFNKSRIKFLIVNAQGKDKLIVFAFPSKEYVFQNAEVIKGWLEYNITHDYEYDIKCVLYPDLNSSICEWSKLNELIAFIGILKGDILVFGYVEQFSELLQSRSFERKYAVDFTKISSAPYYGVNVYRDKETHKRCILLGVEYSFWGEASSHIVEAFADSGVRDFVYLAKAGARIVKDPTNLDYNNLTGGVYSIEKPFYTWTYDDSNSEKGTPKGPYEVKSAIGKYLDRTNTSVKTTAGHISVPSVVGETRVQEKTFHELNPTTIDNEISFIASILEFKNKARDPSSKHRLSCIHYITDFVTPSVATQYDAAPGLDVDDRKAKEKALEKAYSIVALYVSNEGAEDDSEYASAQPIVGEQDNNFPFHHHYQKFMKPADEYSDFATNVERRSNALKLFPSICKSSKKIPQTKNISEITNELLGNRRSTVVVAAAPGSGKSIFMAALFHEYIAGRSELGVAPVYIDLSRWEKELLTGSLSEEKLLEQIAKIEKKSLELSEKSKVILFIDGVDDYCDFRRNVFKNLQRSLKEPYSRIISKRAYPFERWVNKRGQNTGAISHNLEVKFETILPDTSNDRKLIDSLSLIYGKDRQVFESAWLAYRKLFGKQPVNIRLLGILSKEPFVNNEYRSSAEFLLNFVNWYMEYERPDWGFGDDNLIDLSKLSFQLLMTRVRKRTLPQEKLLEKRLSTQSDEMLYFLTAYYVCNKLLMCAEIECDIHETIKELDHIYHNRINRYAKEIVNIDVETQGRYFQAITSMYDHVSVRFKAFMAYLCGRFEEQNVRKRAFSFLNELKQGIKITDFDGDQLVLSRTVYISLIYLGDDAQEYIELMRSHPAWDTVNRGFHLSYYEDKDYYLNPDMLMLDNGEKFPNTCSSLIGKLRSSTAACSPKISTSQLDLSTYTMFSLILNRYHAKTLEKTIQKDEVLELADSLLESNRLGHVVENYLQTVKRIVKNEINPLRELVDSFYNMKHVVRAGWNYENRARIVKNPESVAEHTYVLILLSLSLLPETEEISDLIAKKQLSEKYAAYNKNVIIRMLLVHDYPETKTGDIPSFLKSKTSTENEFNFIQSMIIPGLIKTGSDNENARIGIGNLHKHFEKPFKEFECESNDINSVIAKELDAIECYGQLERYLRLEDTVIPDEELFKKDLKSRVTTEIGKQILSMVELTN